MNNDLVSIIVPIYNSQEYLENCIESILKQTYDNYEVLLINDGSTDRSEEICLKYSCNNKIRYMYKDNSGVSDSRNYGIKQAVGKYICFVDSDDILHPNYLKNLIELIEISDADLSCCMMSKFNYISDIKESENNIDNYGKEFSEKDKYKLIYSKYGGYACNKLYVRKIITANNLKFDNKICMCEDLLFIFEYLKYANLVVCNEKKYYYYRVIQSSASKSLKNMGWFTIFNVIEKLYENRNLYNDEVLYRVMYEYKFRILEAKYRLGFNKDNSLYKTYKDNVEKKEKDFNSINFKFKLKEQIKISIYKYFNYLAFTIKKKKDSKLKL